MEMTDRQKRAYIRRYGVLLKPATVRTGAVYKTVCQGCGQPILSDDSLQEIEVVVTKRSTASFFHRNCAGKVWGSKIR